MAYAGDATSTSALVAILESPRTPVARACAAVEECIAANRDNLRGFFEHCFPPLLKRLFGYDGASWLATAARGGGRDADARALLRLLAPGGALFDAMRAADADAAVRYVFPRERLPAHTQMMLAAPPARRELERWPQYAGGALVPPGGGGGGRDRPPAVHMGTQQYFLCWFAFYAVKGGEGGLGGGGDGGGGGGGAAAGGAAAAAGLGSSVRTRAADALHLVRGRGDAAPRHPYLAALRQLLAELVPRGAGGAAGAAAPAAARRSLGAGRGGGAGGLGAAAAPRGAVLWSTLVEFWLTDADEPVSADCGAPPGAAARGSPGGGGGAPLGPLWAVSYEPPSEDLLDAVAELTAYAVSADGGGGGGARPAPAQGGAAWLPPCPPTLVPAHAAARAAAAAAGPPRLGAAAQPAAQALARRLYRFHHRALRLWPPQRSLKPLLRALTAVLFPWRTRGGGGGGGVLPGGPIAAHVSDLVHRHRDKSAAASSDGYGPEWERHVLSHLPFYTVLLPLFVEASIARVDARGESAAADAADVLGALAAAPALLSLLRGVEADYNRWVEAHGPAGSGGGAGAAVGGGGDAGAHAELLPWLAEQAYDWELAATADASGAPPAARGPPPYALTTLGAGDAAAAASGRALLELCGRVVRPELLARLRAAAEAVLPLAALPGDDAPGGRGRGGGAAAGGGADPPRLPRCTWRDVRLVGDPLLRPVASFELAPLVRATVAASLWANAALGLDRPWRGGDDEEPPEDRWQVALRAARRAGRRVDLRPLADLRNLAALPAAYLALALAWRVAAAAWWLLTLAPDMDDAFSPAAAGAARRPPGLYAHQQGVPHHHPR